MTTTSQRQPTVQSDAAAPERANETELRRAAAALQVSIDD